MWQWNGNDWSDGQIAGVELSWGYTFAAVALVAFPTTLIALVAFTKPIVADVPLSWLPAVWTGLTFCSHLAIVLWLVVEIYQVPITTYLRRSRRYLRRH